MAVCTTGRARSRSATAARPQTDRARPVRGPMAADYPGAALLQSSPGMTVRQIVGEFETVTEVLRAAAAVNADVEAYVEPATEPTPRRSMTFVQWDRAADGVAGLLAGHGVVRGSVVCLLLPSSIDYMVCYAAAARLGAVTSGINLRLGDPEVRSILERTLPAVTVVDDGGRGRPGTDGGRARAVARCGRPWTARPPPPWPALDRSDPVAVVWTSGTTGLPKGAVFDHASLAAVADGTDVLSEPGDRRLSPLPFAHVGSMTRPWDEIANGVTTVITPTPWRAADAIRIMAEERITVAQGVPTQWALVLAHPDLDAADLSSLRIAGTGASRVPAELVAAMRQRLGVPVVVRYTSTEASLGTGTVPGDPDEVVATTVGRPVPGVLMAIADDAGRTRRVGEVGRVRLRSGGGHAGLLGWPRHRSGGRRRGLRPRRHRRGAVRRRVADHRRLRLHRPGRLPPPGGTGQRALHPRRLQRLPGRGGGRAGRAPRRRPGGGGRRPRPGAGRDRGGLRRASAPGRCPTRRDCSPPCGTWPDSSLADYKAPDRLVLVDSLPLTSMMKVDKRSLAERAEQAARHRRRRRDERRPTRRTDP